jgi:hypothetical protein
MLHIFGYTKNEPESVLQEITHNKLRLNEILIKFLYKYLSAFRTLA